MAKYKLFESAFVGETFIRAEPTRPAVIRLDDDVEPSRSWTPLDKAAESAQKKLLESDYDGLPEAEKKGTSKEKWVDTRRSRKEGEAPVAAKIAVQILSEAEGFSDALESEGGKTEVTINRPGGKPAGKGITPSPL